MSEHLDFYREFGVSPVTQDTTDWQRHLQRREVLYRSLGVPAVFMAGKRILEVGSGSGQNSIHIASLHPLELVIVEPNAAGREQIQKNYREWPEQLASPVVLSSTLQELLGSRCDLDLAVAELWLGRSQEGIRMLQGLRDMVRIGGIIIVTASPAVGLLATSLRVALGLRLIEENATFAERTATLLAAFGPHLETLADMSRNKADWVIDNLLNPAALTEVISPPELLEAMSSTHLYNTYPQFFTSWDWYKSMYGDKMDPRTKWIGQYFGVSHNFLDTVSDGTIKDPEAGRLLESSCNDVIERVIKLREGGGGSRVDGELLDLIGVVRGHIPKSKSLVLASVNELVSIYMKKEVSVEGIARMTEFSKWFGREVLYMSFIRT